MATKESNSRELVKIALMYYEEHLTQAEIADRTGISRSLVSKYLSDAEKAGIVSHVIKSVSVYSSRLELELEKTFGLRKAVVVDTSEIDDRFIPHLTFQAAVEGFMRDIMQAHIIGLTWGTTIRGFVDAFPYEKNTGATVVSLIGGMGSTAFEIHANQLTYDLGRKLQARCLYVYAPALVENEEMQKSLLQNTAISDVFDVGEQADFALMGVSSPFFENYTLKRLGYISQEDVDKLKAAGVMGDVNLNFFDWMGNQMNEVLDSRVIGLSIDALKGIDKRATICFQSGRVDALYAVLVSRIINCITVTDKIAQQLISRAEMIRESHGERPWPSNVKL